MRNQLQSFPFPTTDHSGDCHDSRPLEDLNDVELAQALAASRPGAETELSLRAWLRAHPGVSRDKLLPSWKARAASAAQDGKERRTR